jgi:hypothetical protein
MSPHMKKQSEVELYCAVVWIMNVPKNLCVKGLARSLWYYWEVVEPLRGRAQ